MFKWERWNTVKEAQPGLCMLDYIKILSREWKEIDTETKAKYGELSIADKERFV